ncbi:hypothetical protein F132_36 [Flavobacterium sp. phage 1/32]|nr:hypothetical protein F132_36 [Flavobacterium sp. phage 1/32]
MIAILTHYLVFVALLFIAKEKLKLQELGQKSKYKFIYKLSTCDYCFSFWIGVIAVIFISLITSDFSRVDLIMPFIISGIYLIERGLKNE